MTDPTPTRPVVRILPAGIELAVEPGETVVDTIRRHGYRTRYSCRRGGCGACKAQLLAGTVHYRNPVAATVLSDSEQVTGACLPCRAIPDQNIVIRLSERDRLRNVLGLLSRSSTAVPREENTP
ncbi:Ferredoxin-1 [Nocardia cerradoensis]|uniref:Ferredoxin-1 n=2 Tax=Nocardia cerradoensis TaxID=85688 RepID=A0A231H406_9NOCA|nr:Ferredoxin-1 [Nocardia cerradoensis]